MNNIFWCEIFIENAWAKCKWNNLYIQWDSMKYCMKLDGYRWDWIMWMWTEWFYSKNGKDSIGGRNEKKKCQNKIICKMKIRTYWWSTHFDYSFALNHSLAPIDGWNSLFFIFCWTKKLLKCSTEKKKLKIYSFSYILSR